ncbi:MAG: UDP-N-acetylmuramoyl-tripeptide--D-alanyl-D-alanine ligase [Bacteroidales bacterium]
MDEKKINHLLELVDQGYRICTDSRQAKPGYIFFAIRGEHFDGNRFAETALQAGCNLAVIDKPEYNTGDKYLVVNNALSTLQLLGQTRRHRMDIPFIGITGSNGKTTTKELLQAILSTRFVSAATKGNLNNHIGVPLSLLSFPAETECAIVEMGANHQGEIARLCEIAMPTHGLITNIGQAHLEGFGSIENIAKAKNELYTYLDKTNGTLFVNHDDPRLKKITRDMQTIQYGKEDYNHCSGEIIRSSPALHIRFQVNRNFGAAKRGLRGEVKSRLTGGYNFENILAGITVGLYFGVKPEEINRAVGAYVPENHRSQIIHTSRNTVVMDAYNANPSSMAAALDNLALFNDKPRAVFLGDMLELGPIAEAAHRNVIDKVKQMRTSLQVYVGKHFAATCKEEEDTLVFDHVNEAAEWLRNNPIQGYTVLVKGSRGIQMEKLLDYL